MATAGRAVGRLLLLLCLGLGAVVRPATAATGPLQVCLHRRELEGAGFHRTLTTAVRLVGDGAEDFAGEALAVIDSLPVDVFVDPHQVRELPLWGGPEVHVTTSAPEGRVDLEGPAWTGHSTAVLVRTRLNASEGAAAVEATFSYPLHFRYAMPKAGGGFATVPLIPPIAYLLHTGGATELADTLPLTPALEASLSKGGQAPAEWASIRYAGLCDQDNRTDAIVVKDLPTGNSDVAAVVTWTTLFVTTVGALVVAVAAALKPVRS